MWSGGAWKGFFGKLKTEKLRGGSGQRATPKHRGVIPRLHHSQAAEDAPKSSRIPPGTSPDTPCPTGIPWEQTPVPGGRLPPSSSALTPPICLFFFFFLPWGLFASRFDFFFFSGDFFFFFFSARRHSPFRSRYTKRATAAAINNPPPPYCPKKK